MALSISAKAAKRMGAAKTCIL